MGGWEGGSQLAAGGGGAATGAVRGPCDVTGKQKGMGVDVGIDGSVEGRGGRGRTLIVAFPEQTRDDGPRDPVVVNQQHVHVRGGAGRHGDRASRRRRHARPPKKSRRGPRAPRDARHARSRSPTRDGRRGTLGRGPGSARPSLVRDPARASAPARAKQWGGGLPRARSYEKGRGGATSSREQSRGRAESSTGSSE